MPLNRTLLTLLIFIFLVSGCSTSEESTETAKDYEKSYEIGATAGFCELVSYGVKQLGLGVPMMPDKMDEFMPYIEKVAEKHGVLIYRETELIDTDLFTAGIADGYHVPLIYTGATLTQYMDLKEDRRVLEEEGKYTAQAREDIARRFGRLLSYTPRTINNQLSLHTDFRTMHNFGIRASKLQFYYKDLEKAVDFYTKVLGLEVVAEDKSSKTVQLASEAFLTLVDASTAMLYSDKPKTVALAFVTDEPGNWYKYLQEKNIEIKYKYKPKDASAHDGFVAIDPEGYLLEFERFNQHPENERFVAALKNIEAVTPKIQSGFELSLNSSITWLYYKDILGMQNYYQDVLGLELFCDQGWAKIYRVSEAGFIGLVDEKRGMHQFAQDKAVKVSFVLDDLEGWYKYSVQNNIFDQGGGNPDMIGKDDKDSFLGMDPEGYRFCFYQEK